MATEWRSLSLRAPPPDFRAERAELQTGGRPRHVARCEKCTGSADEVRARSFVQPLPPEMVGCSMIASWRGDPGGLRQVPQWLPDELADVFSVLGTKDVEDHFNYARRRVRLALSGTMQQLSQWHNLAHSILAAEPGGSPYPSSRRISTVHKGAFHKSSFQTPKQTLSVVSKWMAQKDWHTPSASNFCHIVYRTSALVEFESDFTM